MDANSMSNSMSNPLQDAANRQAANNTSRCPLCGRDNRCACAAAACLEDGVSCWCFNASIPEPLLNRIPDKLRGIACICPQCVESYHKLKPLE